MILACIIMLLAITTHGATPFVSPLTSRLRLVTARGLPHVPPPRRQLAAPSSPSGAAGDSHLRPVVVCGFSGAGKGALISLLLDACGGGVAFAVSQCTRGPSCPVRGGGSSSVSCVCWLYACALPLRCCVFSLCAFWRSSVLRFRLVFFNQESLLFGCCGLWARGNITTANWQYPGSTAGGQAR